LLLPPFVLGFELLLVGLAPLLIFLPLLLLASAHRIQRGVRGRNKGGRAGGRRRTLAGRFGGCRGGAGRLFFMSLQRRDRILLSLAAQQVLDVRAILRRELHEADRAGPA
jgi:hypothetical protein